jgi:hemerythrin superfamily protein
MAQHESRMWGGRRSSQREWITGRDLAAFGAGALVSFLASRVAPPATGRALGSLRAMAGTDPFDALAQDHRNLIALFGRIEATEQTATYRRATMLFQLKRMLTAHALAEEDVVYPMLRDDAQRAEAASRLYREHADMKIRLFELEHKSKDDPSWIEDLRALRRIFEEHARDEEQEEFPKLREALDEARRADLLGQVQREKSMLL